MAVHWMGTSHSYVSGQSSDHKIQWASGVGGWCELFLSGILKTKILRLLWKKIYLLAFVS